MRSGKLFVQGLTLGAVLCASPLCFAQEADLSPRLNQGAEHRFKVHSVSEVSRSIPELDQKLTQTTDLTYYITRRVTGSEDGVVEAGLVFDRVVFRTQTPNLQGEMENVVYDTGLLDAETGERRGRGALEDTEFIAMQYAKAIDPLIGRSIELTLTPGGAITGVTIPEEMGDSNLFSIEMIKDRFLPLFQINPGDGEVAVGEQWELKSRQDSGLGFDVVSTTRWRLTSVEDPIALISVANEFSMGDIREDSGFTLRDSSGGGEVVWNMKLGILDRLSGQQTVRMAGSPPEIEGAEVELLVRSRIEIQRQDEPWTIEADRDEPAPTDTGPH